MFVTSRFRFVQSGPFGLFGFPLLVESFQQIDFCLQVDRFDKCRFGSFDRTNRPQFQLADGVVRQSTDYQRLSIGNNPF